MRLHRAVLPASCEVISVSALWLGSSGPIQIQRCQWVSIFFPTTTTTTTTTSIIIIIIINPWPPRWKGPAPYFSVSWIKECTFLHETWPSGQQHPTSTIGNGARWGSPWLPGGNLVWSPKWIRNQQPVLHYSRWRANIWRAGQRPISFYDPPKERITGYFPTVQRKKYSSETQMRHNATMRDYGDDAPFIYSHDMTSI